MLAALLLAASLMGPPAPRLQAAASVPVEKIADDVATHLSWIAAGYAADMLGTGYARKHCPTCFEANPLGYQTGDVGILALKTGSAVGTGLIVYRLERGGHHKWATGLSLSYAAVSVFAGIQNTVHGIRGR